MTEEMPLEELRQAASAAAERFVRLQRKFGWWTLAYLEALVKCSDIIASL
jgi:hypothetical protein